MVYKPVVSLDDVKVAANRILRPDRLTATRLIAVPQWAKILGFKSLHIKDETDQPTNTFKVRGVYNHMLQMTEAQKKAGVFAVTMNDPSVAFVASELGITSKLLMPLDAPKITQDLAIKYGADLFFFDRKNEDPEEPARKIVRDFGLHRIDAFNDRHVIAGHGTVGFEIASQMRSRELVADVIVVPCSSGALAAGIALTRDLYKTPKAEKSPLIVTAEPENFDALRASLKEGRIREKRAATPSICEALMARRPGKIPYEILQHHSRQHGVLPLWASDKHVKEAMNLAAQHALFWRSADADDQESLKLEPSGAIGLACAVQYQSRFRGKDVVVVATGGNIDTLPYRTMVVSGLASIEIDRRRALKPKRRGPRLDV